MKVLPAGIHALTRGQAGTGRGIAQGEVADFPAPQRETESQESEEAPWKEVARLLAAKSGAGTAPIAPAVVDRPAVPANAPNRVSNTYAAYGGGLPLVGAATSTTGSVV